MEFSFVPFGVELRPAWDKFVTTHPHAWPGQDAAIIPFAESCGQTSFSHLAYDENGELAAIVPLFLSTSREARLLRFRSLVTGSSLRGGPLLRADFSTRVRRQFMEAWARWVGALARRKGVDNVRAAFPYVMGQTLTSDIYECYPLREFGFREQRTLALLVDLHSPGDLMSRFTPACRKRITRAQRAGCEVVTIDDRPTWLALHPLNVENFKDQPITPFSIESMGLIWDEFVARGLAHVLAVRCEGEYISCAVITGTAHASYTWHVFNRHPLPVPGANNLVIWHGMELARDRGARFYELGSVDVGDPRTQAISTFKQNFGGRMHYGLDGVLVVKGIKQATADWLHAVAKWVRDSRRRETPEDAGSEVQVGKAQ